MAVHVFGTFLNSQALDSKVMVVSQRNTGRHSLKLHAVRLSFTIYEECCSAVFLNLNLRFSRLDDEHEFDWR